MRAGETRGRVRAGAGLLVLLGSRMGSLEGAGKQQALLYSSSLPFGPSSFPFSCSFLKYLVIH